VVENPRTIKQKEKNGTGSSVFFGSLKEAYLLFATCVQQVLCMLLPAQSQDGPS